ncbi:maltose/glucose-specific PTS transporter subunit IIBC [Fusobacterium sp. FSA-380-WT-3A]|uniref:maltose/glucose-specific PTS transporter subunit IIBC n=2 Tax=Fusobacterium TaxID=848 RepID=UPI001476F91C|nr:maltose/glucose-specific PTS transporter subunit IIBC [Fusobacterium sp. FSA-380-WT-3A]NME36669.1 PTS maltose transporter subunit IICB [Fusobacterium sp. FSA-380-WT-3A]
MSKKVGFWEFFQGLGKTFMLPVSLLAACGIMLGIGSSFASSVTAEILPFLKIPVIKLFFEFMSTIGSFAFSNLPMMFAMAIPLGLARQDKGVAAFSGFVGFIMASMTANFFLKATGTLATPENMKAAGQAMVYGIQSVDVGVLGGVIIGVIVYKIHDKYCEIKLPDALAFFGGSRFVPIATAVVVGVVGIVIPLIWPFFNGIIIKIGELIGKAGVFGPLVFGAGEGILRPFGLHHILVAMIRFTSAGGEAVVNGETVYGALSIFYKEFANGVLDPNVTRFLSQGKMPSYLFGLPAVALAIYHTARPENRKKIKGLLASGVVACMVGGITEPLEFIFLFLSPVLYLFHCIMVGLGFMTMGILKVAIGNTDGNIIDFIVFGVLQGFRTKWYLVIPVGIVWFIIYYVVFKYAIVKFDLKTPGREVITDESNVKLGGYDAERLLKALGGKENIVSLDNCITRLRLVLNDTSIINEEEIKATGAIAVVKLDASNLQVIIGPQVHVVKNKLDKLIK